MHDANAHIARLPRVRLAHLPTPIDELPSLSAALGVRILMKRDDLTGLALGGNKTRKLEYLIADARAAEATCVLTAGAAQSNHCRQTAAAAARAGLSCHLVLGGTRPESGNGNLLLDELLGATVHWTSPEQRVERMEEIARDLAGRGERPYIIPYGGSNAVGAVAYVQAMLEASDQLRARAYVIDRIITASSSGGTQAGLALGAREVGFTGELLGISVDKGEHGELPYEEELAGLANATASRLGLDTGFGAGDFRVEYGYLGGGYGVAGELERNAIRMLARLEGILLDPVYTGRAMGAVLDMVHTGTIARGETILFWHTGGAPALFAYARELSTGDAPPPVTDSQ